MEQSRLLMERVAGGPLPEWERIRESGQLRLFAKGSQIFAPGEWQPYVYVIRQGIVKLNYLTEHGQEWIKSFIGEGELFACPTVLISGQKTDYFATALEDSQIEQIDYEILQQLIERHPLWQKVTRQLLESHIMRKEQRERELLTMTPEQRYRAFLAQNPAVFQRIQLRDLAHYLGVTPEALSRIRKRVQM